MLEIIAFHLATNCGVCPRGSHGLSCEWIGKVSKVALFDTQCCGIVLLWKAVAFVVHQNIAVLYDMWLGSANAVSCNNLWGVGEGQVYGYGDESGSVDYFGAAIKLICTLNGENSPCDALSNAKVLYGAYAFVL